MDRFPAVLQTMVVASSADAPAEPKALRLAAESEADGLPDFIYWIRWNGVLILVVDLSGKSKSEADAANLDAAILLESRPAWRAPFLAWIKGVPPPDAASEPVLRRLNDATDRLGERQAVAGLSTLQYLAVRLLNRFRRRKLFPFTTLDQALAYLAPL